MTAEQQTFTHSNTFIFKVVLDGVEEITEQLEGKLLQAGCDDALLASRDRTVFIHSNCKS